MSADHELRLWLGWRKPAAAGGPADWPAFLLQLGTRFLPATWRVMTGFGLRAYLPSIFTAEDDHAARLWPDETALLAYTSRAAYEQHKATPQGQAYGAMHGEVFSFAAGPRRSRSAWAETGGDDATAPRRRLALHGGAHFAQPQARLHLLLIEAEPGLPSRDLLDAAGVHAGEAVAWCVQGMGLLWLAAAQPLSQDEVAGPVLARWPGCRVQGWQVAQPVTQLPAAGLSVADNASWQFCANLTSEQP